MKVTWNSFGNTQWLCVVTQFKDEPGEVRQITEDVSYTHIVMWLKNVAKEIKNATLQAVTGQAVTGGVDNSVQPAETPEVIKLKKEIQNLNIRLKEDAECFRTITQAIPEEFDKAHIYAEYTDRRLSRIYNSRFGSDW